MMSRYLEIEGVSALEHVLEEVFTEMESPGILVFGADSCYHSMLKYDVVRRLFKMIVKRFSANWIVLNGEESCDRAKRHEAVMKLRKRGVENIVGIYVKTDFVRADIDADSPTNFFHNCQVDKLLKSPPTPDGLAYLIAVSEENG